MAQAFALTETMECPLCLGDGELKRTEVLDRLGVKDLARVAQLTAEEAFRLLITKHKQDEQSVWARFESELSRRTGDMKERQGEELQALLTRIMGHVASEQRSWRNSKPFPSAWSN
jgi:hypothetical protein